MKCKFQFFSSELLEETDRYNTWYDVIWVDLITSGTIRGLGSGKFQIHCLKKVMVNSQSFSEIAKLLLWSPKL